MYQTATTTQYQNQPSFVYGSHLTYQATAQPRSSSNSSIRQPSDISFGLDSSGFNTTHLSYKFDPSTTTTATSMSSQDGSKQSPTNHNQVSSMISSGTNSNTTILPENSSNALPPLSEVFASSSSVQTGQTPTTASNTSQQSPVVHSVQAIQAQHHQPTTTTPSNISLSSTGFLQSIQQYPDVNAATAGYASTQGADDVTYATASQLISQSQPSIAQQTTSLTQQLTSNLPVVDPRSLPRIGATASNFEQSNVNAMDPTGRGRSGSLLVNSGLSVDSSDTNPISTNSITMNYQHPVAAAAAAQHHQAILQSHFIAAARSVTNGLITSSGSSINDTRTNGSIENGDMTTRERPQKVYSFVALPGINTKKRPRRKYDEIERHYACNYPGCTKSYGTLNHLNAHIQMQKHGQKRHPSEFKELRKQWRRQKREEEERKATESNLNMAI